MKLFQHSRGFVIAFGFDMLKRKPDPRMICWCDPASGEWEPRSTNQAGMYTMRDRVAPEFVFERQRGEVVAYQPGLCIQMTPIGSPLVWSFSLLHPDEPVRVAA